MTAAHDEGRSPAAARAERFATFCDEVEPRLRRALVAAHGPELGVEATADALSWAWEHFDRVERMHNAPGYLWRVGRTAVRQQERRRRPPPWGVAPSVQAETTFEPRLQTALASLSLRQRAAVLLVHGYGYSLSEAASQMGCRVRTLRNHLERGMHKLRQTMGVVDGV